jgi:hypothetical protein
MAEKKSLSVMSRISKLDGWLAAVGQDTGRPLFGGADVTTTNAKPAR